jgi:hypothetical protein
MIRLSIRSKFKPNRQAGQLEIDLYRGVAKGGDDEAGGKGEGAGYMKQDGDSAGAVLAGSG